MTHVCQTIAVASACLVLITATDARPGQAATLTYDFDVLVDSGPLANQTYSGSFKFDDSNLTGSGQEFPDVSTVMFSFLGEDYTKEDDPAGPEVAFLDGNFLGLSFSTDAAFSVVPGFSDLEEAVFTYDIQGQGVGLGDVSYTVVPEPSSALGTLALSVLGAGWMLKRKQQ